MIPHRIASSDTGKHNLPDHQMLHGITPGLHGASKEPVLLVKPDLASGPEVQHSAKLRLPYVALRHGLAVTDAVLIMIACMTGNEGYQFFENGTVANADQFFGAGVISALLYVLIGQSSGFYELQNLFFIRGSTRRIILQWSFLTLLLAMVAFLMKIGPAFSRGSIVCFASLALVLLLATHRAARRLVASAVAEGQVQGRRAIVIGTRDELAVLHRQELLQRFGLTEVERFAFPSDKNNNLAMGESETTALDNAVARARDRSVDEIVLVLPWSDTRKLELVRDRLRSSPLPIQLLPDRRIRSLAANPSFRLKKSLSIEIQRGPLSRLEQLVKRAVDVGGATIGLFTLFPVMLLAALVIKLDSPGPVFFRQRRNGFNANQFLIFKFRTMSVLEDGAVVNQAKKSDPRVTRVGRILRRSSIDELPQLLNVLFGHMSLVGPRPHALAHDSQYGNLLSEYAFRHHVKPGITGWAQVRGYRGETFRIEQMKGRVDCDLWYINNWSLILDIRILMQTCFEVFRRRNAY